MSKKHGAKGPAERATGKKDDGKQSPKNSGRLSLIGGKR
jgi:hypothetical protein